MIRQEVTLKQLIEQHRHQTTLYLFWRREPSYKNNFLFSLYDYQLEIDYVQGTPFGGAIYLHINQITFRHKQSK
ncbi:hypothetical protein [Candidatus Phytoplasma sacchari]|uniref:Uncharacterized protein n=1 Tax=Candidatus Phytoplasma sacchari TaxID=2609813 RepID=A0ABY7M0S5_9MOLU|nr:hypothetical protein O7R10_01795 [Candidatus Phytoplasma sacchari]